MNPQKLVETLEVKSNSIFLPSLSTSKAQPLVKFAWHMRAHAAVPCFAAVPNGDFNTTLTDVRRRRK